MGHTVIRIFEPKFELTFLVKSIDKIELSEALPAERSDDKQRNADFGNVRRTLNKFNSTPHIVDHCKPSFP